MSSHSHKDFQRAPDAGETLPDSSAKAITKDQLAALPVYRYRGPVRLVTAARELEKALHDIHDEHVVGVDTETRPMFRKGQSHLPSLVQIAVSQAVYLFQLKRMDCSGALASVFADAAITKTGIGLADDFAKLKKLFPFEARNILDLAMVAKKHGIKHSGVRNLAGLLLGVRVTKGTQTSNWARAHLTPRQITYAATDAWICRELYIHFQKLGYLQ